MSPETLAVLAELQGIRFAVLLGALGIMVCIAASAYDAQLSANRMIDAQLSANRMIYTAASPVRGVKK